MRSKANVKTHPIHPILVTFPIAFFVGTFIFDILAQVQQDEHLHVVALYTNIAGVFGAIAAAVAGLTDYIHTVPPESSAKKRAAKHGIINTLVLIIFSIVLYLRHDDNTNFYVVLGLETLAVILLGFAGWMGGTLVYRNQIGVDIRYADAGKWKEIEINEISGEFEVGDVDELKVNQMKLIKLKNKRIVLARTEEGYVAFDDRCPHKGGSLAGGAMICGTVQCPWHGSQFETKTGAVKAGPGKTGIKTYNVRETGNKVFIKVD